MGPPLLLFVLDESASEMGSFLGDEPALTPAPSMLLPLTFWWTLAWRLRSSDLFNRKERNDTLNLAVSRSL